MKKFVVVLSLFVLSTAAWADILLPPTPWELLKRRPEVSDVEVFVPDPASDDVVSPDVVSGDVASGDVASGDES